jgi:hypothetical protein
VLPAGELLRAAAPRSDVTVDITAAWRARIAATLVFVIGVCADLGTWTGTRLASSGTRIVRRIGLPDDLALDRG